MSNGKGYYSGRSSRSGRIAPLYLYIGVGILVLLGIWLLAGFVRTGVEGYFTLVAGVLLIVGNLRDLIRSPFIGRENTALLNTLIGGSLIGFFLGRGGFPPLGSVWYIFAVALLLIAAPLMLGRASVYSAYLGTAKNAVGAVRRVIGSYTRAP
jgi:hypothetical protein